MYMAAFVNYSHMAQYILGFMHSLQSYIFVPMSGGEILLILIIYLLFFGAKGIPTLAQTMGKALYQFRNATRDVQNEIMQSASDIRKQAEVKMDQLDVNETSIRNEGNTHYPPPAPKAAEPEEVKPGASSSE